MQDAAGNEAWPWIRIAVFKKEQSLERGSHLQLLNKVSC